MLGREYAITYDVTTILLLLRRSTYIHNDMVSPDSEYLEGKALPEMMEHYRATCSILYFSNISRNLVLDSTNTMTS